MEILFISESDTVICIIKTLENNFMGSTYKAGAGWSNK